MADRIIASGDARPSTPATQGRDFLTSGETLNRLSRAPEVASLHFNDTAPPASLLALGLARATGAVGIVDVVLEMALPLNVATALEAARDAVDEARLVLLELQRRDGQQYAGGAL